MNSFSSSPASSIAASVYPAVARAKGASQARGVPIDKTPLTKGLPYADEELAGAFPCPVCKTLNLNDARQCVACGAAVAHGGASATHLGPVNTHRRHGHVSHRTVATFSGGHVVFSAGSPAVITADQILEVRTDTSFNSEHYSGTTWVIMLLQDGEYGFMVKLEDAKTWVDALTPRAKPQA